MLRITRIAVVLFFLGAGLAMAQMELLLPNDNKPAVAAAVPVSDPKLSTPRDTVRTFMDGMSRWDDGGLEDALKALDLSNIDATVRDDRGAVLADMIKQVLIRDPRGPIVYKDIPLAPESGEWVQFKEAGVGQVVIALIEQNGTREWKYSAATLDNIEQVYDAVYKRPVTVNDAEDTGPRTSALRMRNWVGEKFPILLSEFLFLQNWQWLGLFVIILAGFLLSRIVSLILTSAIQKWYHREAISLDQKAEHAFAKPIRIALMAWVWLLGLSTLGLPVKALVALKVAVVVISGFAGIWALYRLVDIIGAFLAARARRTHNKFDDLLVPLITRTLKVFIVVMGLVTVAQSLNLPVQGLLAGLGLGGLAFALAAKDTVANLFGSLTIILDRPFHIGDWVRIGDIDGSVESVGIRSTRVRTFYNSLITVPNAELTNATIDNMGSRRYRRVKTMLSVAYDTPPEKIDAFCEGIRQLILEHPYTRKDYYHVYLNGFGATSLNILLYCFHETPDWSTELRERHRLFNDIIRLAKNLNVEFAFPTQTLYMRSEETPTHADIDDPLGVGRDEASRIVAETLGKDVPKPPPVDFTMPAHGADDES